MMIPDLRDTDPARGFTPVPDGSYLAQIIDAEERTAASGSEYISVKFEIVDPVQYAGRWLYSSLHFGEAALGFTKAKLDAIGYDTSGGHRFAPERFIGKRARLEVGQRTYMKDGEQRSINEVLEWEKPSASAGADPLARAAAAKQPPDKPVPSASTQQAVSPDPDDDIPF